MKELFRNEAKLAIDFVNIELGIKSTNRPDDKPAPDGMAKLAEQKKVFQELKSDKKLAPVNEWRSDLQAKEKLLEVLLKELIEVSKKLDEKDLDANTAKALQAETQRIAQSRKLLMTETEKLKRDIKSAGEFTPKESARVTAKAAREARFGNCEEKASVAYFFLRKRGIRPIELIASGQHRENPGDSHQFVVIGRKKAENIDDPDSWSEAAVCDPWDDSVYEPKELPDKLMAFGYLDIFNLCLREDS